MKSLLVATALLALTTGGAFAQTTTTGSGATNSMATPSSAAKSTQQKDKSPGATDSGVKQEK